mmetsp:Transcript_62960/g.148329  ORF Transcript_62960/g.148329 Transcript_62960/m.148329 type:complete len:283 (-) Transcript_62960:327-1175(-)
MPLLVSSRRSPATLSPSDSAQCARRSASAPAGRRAVAIVGGRPDVASRRRLRPKHSHRPRQRSLHHLLYPLRVVAAQERADAGGDGDAGGEAAGVGVGGAAEGKRVRLHRRSIPEPRHPRDGRAHHPSVGGGGPLAGARPPLARHSSRLRAEVLALQHRLGLRAQACAARVAELREAALLPRHEPPSKVLLVCSPARRKQRLQDEYELVCVVRPIARSPHCPMQVRFDPSSALRRERIIVPVELLYRLPREKFGRKPRRIGQGRTKEQSSHTVRHSVERKRG